jgi:hypothetical protein
MTSRLNSDAGPNKTEDRAVKEASYRAVYHSTSTRESLALQTNPKCVQMESPTELATAPTINPPKVPPTRQQTAIPRWLLTATPTFVTVRPKRHSQVQRLMSVVSQVVVTVRPTRHSPNKDIRDKSPKYSVSVANIINDDNPTKAQQFRIPAKR